MSDARLTSLGEGKGPIVLQGAMEMEVAPFIKRLKGAELEVYGDFFFWRGTFGTRPLIISQTGIGTAAAGAATALACALYQPSLIVNQGTAGGYGDLAVGDVVLASALYNATPAIWGVMACVSWSLAALNTSPWLPWTSPMCRRFLRRMKGSDIYWRLFSKKRRFLPHGHHRLK